MATKKKKKTNLRIKFVPYERFKENHLNKFLDGIGPNTIILVDAKLRPDEEANLIKETMERVNDRFSGIDLNSLELSGEKKAGNLDRVKSMVIERLVGKKPGLTIIGPAKTVRQIRKNPEELLLYM